MYPVLSEANGHKGIYDFNENRWVVAPRFRSIYPFSNGYAHAIQECGAMCMVDRNDTTCTLDEIVRPVCKEATVASFIQADDVLPNKHCGCAVLHDAEHQYLVMLGAHLRPTLVDRIPRTEEATIYFDNQWLVCRTPDVDGSRFTLTRGDQKLTIENVVHVWASKDGFFSVKKAPNRCAFYCPNNAEFVGDWYHFAAAFSERVGLVRRHAQSRTHFLNEELETIPELDFEWANVFRFGLALQLAMASAATMELMESARYRWLTSTSAPYLIESETLCLCPMLSVVSGALSTTKGMC